MSLRSRIRNIILVAFANGLHCSTEHLETALKRHRITVDNRVSLQVQLSQVRNELLAEIKVDRLASTGRMTLDEIANIEKKLQGKQVQARVSKLLVARELDPAVVRKVAKAA